MSMLSRQANEILIWVIGQLPTRWVGSCFEFPASLENSRLVIRQRSPNRRGISLSGRSPHFH